MTASSQLQQGGGPSAYSSSIGANSGGGGANSSAAAVNEATLKLLHQQPQQQYVSGGGGGGLSSAASMSFVAASGGGSGSRPPPTTTTQHLHQAADRNLESDLQEYMENARRIRLDKLNEQHDQIVGSYGAKPVCNGLNRRHCGKALTTDTAIERGLCAKHYSAMQHYHDDRLKAARKYARLQLAARRKAQREQTIQRKIVAMMKKANEDAAAYGLSANDIQTYIRNHGGGAASSSGDYTPLDELVSLKL